MHAQLASSQMVAMQGGVLNVSAEDPYGNVQHE